MCVCVCVCLCVLGQVRGRGNQGLQGDMAEEVRDRFAIVSPPDGFSEDHGDIDDLEKTDTSTH